MATVTVNAQYKTRRDTATNWATNNPIVPDGVMALETDTNLFKFGDGTTAYNTLDYASAASSTLLDTSLGDIKFTAIATEKNGWKNCDYQTLNQVTFSGLKETLETEFGSTHVFAKTNSDATTAESAGTFHLPDAVSQTLRTKYLNFSDSASTIFTNVSSDLTLNVPSGVETDVPKKVWPFRIIPVSGGTAPTGLTLYDTYWASLDPGGSPDDDALIYTSESDALNATSEVTYTDSGSGTLRITDIGVIVGNAMQGHYHDQYAGTQITSGAGPDRGISSTANSNQMATDANRSPITDGVNGTPSTSNETRGDNLFINVQMKCSSVLSSGSTVDATVRDTGWVANSDWTDAELTATHGLNAELGDLDVRFLISTDGTDTNAFEPRSTSDNNTGPYGFTVFRTSANAIKVQTATAGLLYVTDAGAITVIDTESWYYRIVVTKTSKINNVMSSDEQTVSLTGGGTSQPIIVPTNAVGDYYIKFSGGTPGTDTGVIDSGGEGIQSSDGANLTDSQVVFQGAGTLHLHRTITSNRWRMVGGIWDSGTVADSGNNINRVFDKYVNKCMRQTGEADPGNVAITTGVDSGFTTSGVAVSPVFGLTFTTVESAHGINGGSSAGPWWTEDNLTTSGFNVRGHYWSSLASEDLDYQYTAWGTWA